MEKMKGILAELKTYSESGLEIDSKVVFKPYCEYYIEPLHDGYAETSYSDIGAVIDDFGIEVATKVIEGDLVEVERDVPEGFRQTSCPVDPKIVKISSQIRYPWPGARKEYLIRERA